VRSDEERVVVRLDLDPSEIVQSEVRGKLEVRARGFGLRLGATDLALPYRVDFIAIPEGARPRLRILSASDPMPIRRAAAAASPAGAGGPVGDLPVSLGTIGYFRDQRFVELRWSPIEIGDSPGWLKVHAGLEVEVSWSGGAVSSAATAGAHGGDPWLEPAYSQIFLNAEQGRTFRTRGRAAAQGEGTASTTETQFLSVTSAQAIEPSLVQPVGPRLRIEVAREGVVRITQAQLSAVAPDLAAVDPRALRLSYRGSELPLFVAGESDGSLGAADYLEFFGMPPDDAPLRQISAPPQTFQPIWQLSDFTDVNVYWLDAPGTGRLRPESVNGAPSRGFPLAADWPSVARFEDSGIFKPFGDNDPWASCPRVQDRSCGPISCCQAPDHDFSLSLSDPAPAGEASVRVALQGWTAGPHRVEVRLNGSLLSATPVEWSDFYDTEQAYAANTGSLTASPVVNVRTPGNGTGSTDQVAVDFIEIGYRRRFTARGGELLFRDAGADRRYTLDGFAAPPVAWYELSREDPATGHPILRRIDGAQVTPASAGGYQTTFEAAAEGLAQRAVLVAGAEAVRAPAALRRVDTPLLCDPAVGADLIVLGHPDLLDLSSGSALQEYVQMRQAQGLRVRLISILEVFDQFSGGLPDVEAVRDFLSCAYSTWQGPPPAYALLLGDGSSDYKNRKSLAAWRNQVPTPVHAVEDALFAYYSADAWYAAFRGGDFLPDILLGRLSAGNSDEAERALRKIVRYESAPPAGDWRSRGVFVAGDGNDPTQDAIFPQDSDAAAAWFAPPFSAGKLYYSQAPYGGTDRLRFRSDLFAELDGGSAIVNYIGHGNFTIWDGDQILTVADVASLRNTDRLPVYVNFTCLMGGFHLDSMETLGEALLESTPDTGAVAVVAPSGLSSFNIDADINKVLYSAMMGPRRLRTLGEILLAPRQMLANQGSILELENMTLLGDPALRVALPAPAPPSGLTAAAGNQRVDLAWSPAPNPVAGYHVYRTQSLDPSALGTAVYARLTGSPVAATSYADTTAKNITTYHYTVAAVDAGGFESAYSNLNAGCSGGGADCVRATPYNPNPPSAPRGLTAQNPGAGYRIDLTWLPNPETDLRHYTVHYGTAGGIYDQHRNVGLATSARIEGLSNDVRYHFAVTATNTSDGYTPPGASEPLRNESAPSAEVSAVPTLLLGIRPPAMIRDLRIERDGSDPPSLRLRWSRPIVDIYGDPATVVEFQVHRSEARDFKPTTDTLRARLTADVLSWPDPGAYADTRAFNYVVLAADGAGLLSSASRAQPTGVTDFRLAEEREVTSGAPTGYLILSWGAVTRDIEGQPTVVDHYEIYGAAAPFGREDISSTPLVGSVGGLSLRVPVPASRIFYYSVVAADRRGNLSPF
jgi:hypothetical protein